MEFADLLKFVKEENERLIESYYKQYDEEKLLFSATVKLVEEVGELCQEVLNKSNAQRAEKLAAENDLKNEIADVLITTLIIAELTGVDPQRALEEKVKKIEARHKEAVNV